MALLIDHDLDIIIIKDTKQNFYILLFKKIEVLGILLQPPMGQGDLLPIFLTLQWLDRSTVRSYPSYIVNTGPEQYPGWSS